MLIDDDDDEDEEKEESMIGVMGNNNNNNIDQSTFLSRTFCIPEFVRHFILERIRSWERAENRNITRHNEKVRKRNEIRRKFAATIEEEERATNGIHQTVSTMRQEVATIQSSLSAILYDGNGTIPMGKEVQARLMADSIIRKNEMIKEKEQEIERRREMVSTFTKRNIQTHIDSTSQRLNKLFEKAGYAAIEEAKKELTTTTATAIHSDEPYAEWTRNDNGNRAIQTSTDTTTTTDPAMDILTKMSQDIQSRMVQERLQIEIDHKNRIAYDLQQMIMERQQQSQQPLQPQQQQPSSYTTNTTTTTTITPQSSRMAISSIGIDET